MYKKTKENGSRSQQTFIYHLFVVFSVSKARADQTLIILIQAYNSRIMKGKVDDFGYSSAYHANSPCELCILRAKNHIGVSKR